MGEQYPVEPGKRHHLPVDHLDDAEGCGGVAGLGPVDGIPRPLDHQAVSERTERHGPTPVLVGALGGRFAVVLVGAEEAGAASAVGQEYEPEERRVLPELVGDALTLRVAEYLRGRDVSEGLEACPGRELGYRP